MRAFHLRATVQKPATPFVDMLASSKASSLRDFSIDGKQSDKLFTTPTIYGGSIAAGAIIIIQSDDRSSKISA
ncbi:hypothetical protein [Methylosinus sp. Ce-a6]|uniref:hypothetical protein n=1 Tax=Methylosinus sp. Ce-a6 TaxID=2172005 RepID=UPI001357ADEA|nr:hypothetical protein [Methylosinus sp. Ce-a6]